MFLLVGTSVRSLMESAVQSGYEAVGIDYFGDVDTGWKGKTISVYRDYCLKPIAKNLLDVAKKIPCEGLVYASGPENVPEELTFWAEQGLLLGNTPSILSQVRNPWKVLQCVKKIQGKMPEFYSVKRWETLKRNKKWLLKPINRAGGNGIIELPDKEDVSDMLKSLSHPQQFIIQEFIEGIPGSITFLANGTEAIVLGTSRQLAGRKEESRQFCYQGNITPFNLQKMGNAAELKKKLAKLIKQMTKYFGLKGINTLDFILNSEGVWVLELNPRWSASVELIEQYLGKRLFSHHLASCTGKLPEISQLQASGEAFFWGKSIVYAHNFLVIKKIEEKTFHFLYEQGVRDLSRPGTIIEKGQPICTVLARGATEESCCLKLQAKEKWVRQYFEEVLTDN